MNLVLLIHSRDGHRCIYTAAMGIIRKNWWRLSCVKISRYL